MDTSAIQTPLERTRVRLQASIRERDAARPNSYMREFHQGRIDELLEEYLRLLNSK